MVANGNINVVTNLLYEQEPVTMTASSGAVDSPVSNMSNQTQVLGIYTNNGLLGL